MKKIGISVLAIALLFNLAIPAFAHEDVSHPDSVQTISVCETEYTPRNATPLSTESTVAFIQPYATSKCWECGSSTRVIKKAIWETAICGHYAYWDGSICTNSRCQMPYMDRIYTTCGHW